MGDETDDETHESLPLGAGFLLLLAAPASALEGSGHIDPVAFVALSLALILLAAKCSSRDMGDSWRPRHG